MTFVEPVTRKEGKSYGKATHWYVDGNGLKIPGVTSLLSAGVPKPALVGWGIKSVAEYALDHWDELADLPLSERLKVLKGSPYAERDAAANRGTEVHALAEKLVHGEEVDVPDELAGHVTAYVEFLDTYEVEPVMVETTVYNLTYGWAGTLDLAARLKGFDGLSLCDVKTSKGVYGETAFQIAGYKWAESWLDPSGKPQPMPTFDHTFVIHVRADGYSLRPVVADEKVLLQLRYIAAVARAVDDAKGYILDEVPAAVPA